MYQALRLTHTRILDFLGSAKAQQGARSGGSAPDMDKGHEKIGAARHQALQ